MPTNEDSLLYSTPLKGNKMLYIKNNSIVVIHEKKGRILTLDLSTLRCPLATSHDSFKVFWRASKNKNNTQWTYFKIYQQEFKLDLKKSFPDKKQRKMVEKTESKKIANIILHAIQNTHSLNELNTRANLAMHTGEYVCGIYEGKCKAGDGELVITNLEIYFVSFKKGLYFALPLDNFALPLDNFALPLDNFALHDFKNKTVKIYYYDPTSSDGNASSYNNEHEFKVKIKDKDPSLVYHTIKTAYTDNSEKEIKELQTLTKEFGSLTLDELYAAYYTNKPGDQKFIDRYLTLLAKRKLGVANTSAITV